MILPLARRMCRLTMSVIGSLLIGSMAIRPGQDRPGSDSGSPAARNRHVPCHCRAAGSLVALRFVSNSTRLGRQPRLDEGVAVEVLVGDLGEAALQFVHRVFDLGGSGPPVSHYLTLADLDESVLPIR